MIPDAQIIVVRHEDFMGGTERLEYRWEGGSVVEVDDRFIQQSGVNEKLTPGKVVSVGPFRLRVIDRNLPMRSYILTRTGFVGTAKYTAYHLTKHLDFIYRRLILTAVVWGLANYNGYQPPTWRDIYFLDWLFRGEK